MPGSLAQPSLNLQNRHTASSPAGRPNRAARRDRTTNRSARCGVTAADDTHDATGDPEADIRHDIRHADRQGGHMSVIAILRIPGNPADLEQYAAGPGGEVMRRIAEAGRSAGAIRHQFAGGDNEVLIIDEWPDEQTFQA